MLWRPNPFQPEMVNWLLDHDEASLWAGCGSGKTVVSLTAISELIQQGISRGALIIAPFRVIATSFPAQVEKWDHLRWLKLANMRTPEGQQAWEDGSADLYLINSEMLPTITRNIRCRKCKAEGCGDCKDGFIEQVSPGFVDRFIKKRKALPVDTLLVDECFPPGTLVDTPKGPKRIEDLRKNDRILNVVGEDSINETLRNEVFAIVRIRCAGRTITCSENHRFLTQAGWKTAKTLQREDTLVSTAKAMSLLREEFRCHIEKPEQTSLWSVLCGQNDSEGIKRKTAHELRVVRGRIPATPFDETDSFLRMVLFREMEEPTVPSSCHRRGEEAKVRTAQEVACVGVRDISESHQAHYRIVPHAKSSFGGEAKSVSEEDRPQTPRARGEWPSNARGSTSTGTATQIRGIPRIRHPYQNSQKLRYGFPYSLQDRHSGAHEENSHRGRWGQSQQPTSEREGRPQRLVSLGARVDSVEIYEQNHPELDKFRDAEGRIYFYDLRIRRHPSYSVEGFLVHNCSLAKNPSSVRFNALRPYLHDIEKLDGKRSFQSPFRRKFGMTGTPHPNSYLDLFAQVRLIDGGKRFGTAFTRFRDRYFTSDYMGFKWELKPGAKEEIDAKLADLALVMPPECYPDLPPCITEDVEVTLPSDAMKAYRILEKELLVELETGTVIALSAAALTTKLLQLTSGQVLDSERGVHVTHDAKLKALRQIRKKHPKEPLIVFTSYIHERERILKEFPEARLFDEKRISEWQDGKIPMWVCDCRSMAFGIDGLQVGGRICVWMTPTYSWEMDHQAISRLIRTGQTQETIIYRVLAVGTIDEAVREAVKNKEEGNSGLLNALRNLQALRKT